MTLLVTFYAAIISTVVWYLCDKRNDMKVGTLSLMYWGASLMWFVDAIFEYIEEGAAYFSALTVGAFSEFLLGVSVVALGLMIWIVLFLIHDPKKVLATAILKKDL